jgi:hypothetical protein
MPPNAKLDKASSSSLVDVWTPLSTELGNISEISTPRLNLVGKYSSELWASKQPHRVAKPAHMPEIRDYHSTLAASTRNSFCEGK